jgi:choline-sulfatase
MVSHIDDLTGKIVRQAEESGLLDNTIIVYTSDHGEMLGRHKLWHKMNFYEDSIRVPLVVSCPSKYARGLRVKSNVSLLDIFPTFMEIGENKEEISVDGHSLVPFLKGDNPEWDNSVISESIGVERGKPGRMLKRDNFKLIYYHQGKPLLFDLEADPDELNNLAGSEKHKSILNSMLNELMESWDVQEINRRFEDNLKHVYYHHKLSRMN